MRRRAEHLHDGLRRDLEWRFVPFLLIVLSLSVFVPPAGRGEDVQIAHAGGQSAETGRAGALRIAAGNAHGLDIDRVGDRDLGGRFEVRREGGHLVERIDPAVRAGVAILAGHCSRQRFAIRGAVPGRGGVTSEISGFEGISGARGGGNSLLDNRCAGGISVVTSGLNLGLLMRSRRSRRKPRGMVSPRSSAGRTASSGLRCRASAGVNVGAE